MWVPRSETELATVVASGSVEEGPTLDLKRALPTGSRSRDLAIDVAAMASYGGVLIYGVAEDDRGRAATLTPIELAGARERVEAIVRSSISEPPQLEVRSIPSDQGEGLGYLVVIVPPSARAPHMVTSGRDNRYWGRSGAANVRLNEGEVAELYARRARSETDRLDMLQQARSRAPQLEDPGGTLHVVARPVLPAAGLLAANRLGQEVTELVPTLIATAARAERFAGADWSNAWRDLHNASPYRRLRSRVWSSFGPAHALPELLAGLGPHGYSYGLLELEIAEDGLVRLWSAGAVVNADNEEVGVGPRFFEHLVAQRGTLTLVLAGLLYEAAGHLGPVDVGILIDGLQGASSAQVRRASYGQMGAPIDVTEYADSRLVTVDRLASDGRRLMADLMQPLSQLLSGGGYSPSADPFAHPRA